MPSSVEVAEASLSETICSSSLPVLRSICMCCRTLVVCMCCFGWCLMSFVVSRLGLVVVPVVVYMLFVFLGLILLLLLLMSFLEDVEVVLFSRGKFPVVLLSIVCVSSCVDVREV